MSESTVMHVDAERGLATLTLDRHIYPLDVVYGAAYVFIDRAYVLLDRDAQGRIVMQVSPKDGGDGDALRALAGDVANELLAQALRRKVMRHNRAIVEAIVTQALAGATGALAAPPLDDEDDDLDFLDDPLGIAVPWEEKFGKKARTRAEAEPSTPDAAGPGDAGGFQPVPPGDGEEDA